MDFGKYLRNAVDWFVVSGPKIVLILVLMFVGIKLARWVAERMFSKRRREADEEYKKRTDTLSNVITYVLSATIVTAWRLTSPPIATGGMNAAISSV